MLTESARRIARMLPWLESDARRVYGRWIWMDANPYRLVGAGLLAGASAPVARAPSIPLARVQLDASSLLRSLCAAVGNLLLHGTALDGTQHF